MNQSDLPNPPRLHRRQTRTHPNNSPPKLAFNFKKLKELLCTMWKNEKMGVLNSKKNS